MTRARAFGVAIGFALAFSTAAAAQDGTPVAPPAGATPGPAASNAAPAAPPASGSGYPTVAIGDYVYACIKANGETQEALQHCSCSIDTIASVLPYQAYEDASTYLSLGQVTGEEGGLFRDSALSRAAIEKLRRAQAEAEVLCF